MAKEDSRCSQLKQEHTFLWVPEQKKWMCSTVTCDESITEKEMDSIVERKVSLEGGHRMFIWPAQVEQERNR